MDINQIKFTNLNAVRVLQATASDFNAKLKCNSLLFPFTFNFYAII